MATRWFSSRNAGRLFCYDQVRCFSSLLCQKSKGWAIGCHPLNGLHDSLHMYNIKIRIQVPNRSCTRSLGVWSLRPPAGGIPAGAVVRLIFIWGHHTDEAADVCGASAGADPGLGVILGWPLIGGQGRWGWTRCFDAWPEDSHYDWDSSDKFDRTDIQLVKESRIRLSTVWIYNSVASPGGSIRRSPSSPVANVNDPKVNLVPRGNLTSNVQGAIAFLDGSWVLSPIWRASVNVVSSNIWSRNGKSATMQDQSRGRTQQFFRLVRDLWRVKILRPVLLYYEV
jgi:hypothetical protein